MQQRSSARPQRLHLLDVLRAVTAFVTLVWHYQNFYSETGERLPAWFRPDMQPFYWLLKPLYHHGNMRVDIFFILSGYVLFSIYFLSINSGKTSASKFFLLRFSRLYPMHFITLVIVACLQIVAMVYLNREIVYGHNDAYHFTLQLFMVSNWWFHQGVSFNGPFWSVSIEVLLYIHFFLFALFMPRMKGLALAATFAIIAAALAAEVAWGHRNLPHSFLCFYAGVAVCHLTEWLDKRSLTERRAVLGAAMAIVVGSFLAMGLTAWVPVRAYLGGLVFPALILSLILIQRELPEFGKSIGGAGDYTYALLLVHFPIQATVMIVCALAGITIDYGSGWTFAAFVAVSVSAAVASHLYIEKPVQAYMRTLTAKEVLEPLNRPQNGKLVPVQASMQVAKGA